MLYSRSLLVLLTFFKLGERGEEGGGFSLLQKLHWVFFIYFFLLICIFQFSTKITYSVCTQMVDCKNCHLP